MTSNNNLKLNNLPVPESLIKRRVYIIRGQQVMLDSDLSELYQVSTKRLNEAVKRNLDRFPEDFIFQLTSKEAGNLRSQIATSSYGGRRYLPYAFTEHGVAMLASVLKSKPAVEMSILIVRTFIQMRKTIAEYQDLSGRLDKVENKTKLHNQVLTGLVLDIKKLKNPPKTRAIGFRWKK